MDTEKWVKNMLEKAENPDPEQKVVLVKDVDVAEVEGLAKELQDKIQKRKI